MHASAEPQMCWTFLYVQLEVFRKAWSILTRQKLCFVATKAKPSANIPSILSTFWYESLQSQKVRCLSEIVQPYSTVGHLSQGSLDFWLQSGRVGLTHTLSVWLLHLPVLQWTVIFRLTIDNQRLNFSAWTPKSKSLIRLTDGSNSASFLLASLPFIVALRLYDAI